MLLWDWRRTRWFAVFSGELAGGHPGGRNNVERPPSPPELLDLDAGDLRTWPGNVMQVRQEYKMQVRRALFDVLRDCKSIEVLVSVFAHLRVQSNLHRI